MNHFVVVVGNPVDGISIHGPFDSIDEAHEWAEENSNEWWCALLYMPQSSVRRTGGWNPSEGVFSPEDDSVFGPM